MPNEKPNQDPPSSRDAQAKWSRYQQVKKILNEASGDAHPSYQGHGLFWNLPHCEFLHVTLYGVRMIAPAFASPFAPLFPVFAATAPQAKSCCHEPQEQSAAPAPQPKMTGRGASSGLILGLEGLAPFDGSQFPRLPWGGTPVSLADIQFIEKWIDDGCPETDEPDVGAQAAGEIAALASGRAEFAAHQGPTNALRNAHGSVKVRKNVKCLTPDELQRFRNAVAQMKSLDMYEQDERSFGYWARIHASQCQHSWEEFLTWHRAYLYFFEQRLQDIDPTVTLPYWDWSADRENVIASINDMGSQAAMDNGYIPEEYGCWIDQQGIDALKANGVPQGTLDKLASILGKPPYSSGNRLFLAAGIKWGDDPSSDLAVIQVLKMINPLWHYQRWPGGDKLLIFEAYPSPDDVTRILQISDFFNFGSGPEDNHFFGALENLHNLIHNFSGGVNPNYGASTEPMNVNNPQNGDMVNAGRTAFDPIFWAHHANVDRLWHEWQKLNPSGGPDDPDDILSPWTMTVADTYSIATLGYEYVKSSHSFPAESNLPIKRFVSQPAGVHPCAVSSHRRAEVRLHHVQYTTVAGFFIRVFLNQPDADVSTPTQNNPHYVGMQSMFTGLCIGGPGHCAPPPTTPRRKFDLRPRSHKTPANFRFDCTDTIARLRQQGDPDFQVTIVLVNIDGTAATEALHMAGISLDFFD